VIEREREKNRGKEREGQSDIDRKANRGDRYADREMIERDRGRLIMREYVRKTMGAIEEDRRKVR
jgi:hypothetical protein